MVDPIKLIYKPGIQREVTEYSAMGCYVDGNLARFYKGFPQSVGGWRRLTTEPFVGEARGLFPFVPLDGARLYAMGTSDKYYTVIGTELIDITPLRDTETLTNPFTTIDGSTTVTVADVDHQGQVGDFVSFSDATNVGGVTIDGEYRIASLVSDDAYTIVIATPATSGATGGGTVTAAYQIPIGINATSSGLGWGTGPYGEGGWGEPSPGSNTARLRLWSQDKFGEDLVVCLRDGPLFYYDVSLGLQYRMVELSTMAGANQVPTIARQVLLSDNDRHIIAFGCNGYTDSVQDRLLVRWCNREQVTEWAVSTTTTAASLRVDAGSEIVCAIKVADSIMIFTDVSLHSMRYVGSSFIFGQVKVADEIHIMGPNAAFVVGADLYFMGTSKFFIYNGVVTELPCDVEAYIFEIFNFDEREKVWCDFNSLYGEVTWLLPVNGSTEPNFYVTYNIAEQVWTYGVFGAVARTSWLDVFFEQYPMATATDGYIYLHDIGSTDGTVSPPIGLDSWIEAAPIEIGSGDDFMICDRIIPDVDFNGSSATTPAVTITLTMVDAPGLAPRATTRSLTTKTIAKTSSFPVEQHTAQKDLRLRGRSMKYKIAAAVAGTQWRQGTHRLYIHPDGKR